MIEGVPMCGAWVLGGLMSLAFLLGLAVSMAVSFYLLHNILTERSERPERPLMT